MIYKKKLDRANNILLCGTSSCGKGHKVKQLTKTETRLLVFDIAEDWGEKEKVQVVSDDIMQVMQLIKRDKFRVAFRPSVEDERGQFDKLNRLVMAMGAMCYMVDELSELVDSRFQLPSWKLLCKRGRHRGIKLRAVTDRPAETDKSIVSHATEIYAGQLVEPSDLAPLRARMGKEMAAKIPLLPLRKLLHWKKG